MVTNFAMVYFSTKDGSAFDAEQWQEEAAATASEEATQEEVPAKAESVNEAPAEAVKTETAPAAAEQAAPATDAKPASVPATPEPPSSK